MGETRKRIVPRNPRYMKHGFRLCIETLHVDGPPTTENIFRRSWGEMIVSILCTGTRTVAGETQTEGGGPHRYSERSGGDQRLQGDGRSYQIQVDEDGSRAATGARLEGQS
ncbi:hypothetical protein MML48_9g00020638 [Holotrichia oblita]|uniref:Uncharacterized protein n=1 Tax=Holotrichia oblita TaxID=644536 RepID=A0ACB9SIF6_HOLOL|nr:hypothetical protein MML48_9g00020638 [Holotrichia oblita]